ncbi:MAG: hypothetical protein N3B01_11530, partial [Verrucomicrobiae bacterium]|nr:hypothetical protein [Verrucomicrobiae bacterium]
GAVAFGAGLLWFVPMVMMSGGLALYLEVVRRHAAFNAPASLLGGGLDAFMWNMFFAGLFVGHGLMLGGVVLFAALWYRAHWLDQERKRAFDRQHWQAWVVLTLWIGAFVAAGTVGFTKQPGYVLGYLPALWLLVAVAVAYIRRVAVRWLVIVLVVGVNAFTFLAWPRAWDRAFFDLARTQRELREHDRLIAETVRVIRERYRPDEVTLLHANEFLWFGLMHFHLYLPEYEQYQLRLDPTIVTPPDRPMLSVRDGQLRFVADVDLGGRPTLLLLVPYPLTVEVFAEYFDVGPARRVSDTVYEMEAGAWRRQR